MTNKHIQEPTREIPIYDECDILVVEVRAAHSCQEGICPLHQILII